MSIKKVKPAYFLGANLNDPKVLGSKIDEIISAVNRLSQSATQEIDALIGGGQTGATALIVGFNLVNTETTDDSVILPCLSALCTCEGPCAPADSCGCEGGLVYPVIIKNDGPGDLNVYPCLGDSIDGGAPNAPIVLVSGESLSLTELDCLSWESFANTTDPASVGVLSVTGCLVDNTDPVNPVIMDIEVDGVTITGSGCPGDPLTAVSAGGLSAFAMFYGLTAGTGMAGTDYAATVAPGAAVPFPQDGPALGGIVSTTDTTFTIPAIGTYEVTFRVHTTEPGQLQLTLDGTVLPQSTAVNMNPTAGGHPIIGNVIITTTLINQVLSVINPAGNSPALTITPADGASTHANSQSLVIKRLA